MKKLLFTLSIFSSAAIANNHQLGFNISSATIETQKDWSVNYAFVNYDIEIINNLSLSLRGGAGLKGDTRHYKNTPPSKDYHIVEKMSLKKVINLNLIYQIEIGTYQPYLSLGYSHFSTRFERSIKLSNNEKNYQTQTSLSKGIGINYSLSKNSFINLEYLDTGENKDGMSVSSLSFGVKQLF